MKNTDLESIEGNLIKLFNHKKALRRKFNTAYMEYRDDEAKRARESYFDTQAEINKLIYKYYIKTTNEIL